MFSADVPSREKVGGHAYMVCTAQSRSYSGCFAPLGGCALPGSVTVTLYYFSSTFVQLTLQSAHALSLSHTHNHCDTQWHNHTHTHNLISRTYKDVCNPPRRVSIIFTSAAQPTLTLYLPPPPLFLVLSLYVPFQADLQAA
jgi:hypothetical protein